MPSLQEVVDHSRKGESNGPVQEKGNSTYLDDAQRSGSRAHMEFDGLVDSDKDPGLGQPEGGREEDGNGKRNNQQQADGKNTTADPNFQDQFYRGYREVADEYDKEFLMKYNEDLNTTLIFAGLFSAVASAFINSELKPDPNDETAALLRVLLYKLDNTTFGTDVPPLPQWSGPAEAIVQVQAILFASLAASLLSAFLAVLGKQWLSRYDSADIKGTTAERAQNRQRKLDGINTWHFHYAMEALPVMLQFALLLLGCALSRYLWQVNIVVASVVIGVTSLGMTFYLAIVVAGTADESCPYQTPVVNVLRQVLHQILRLLRIPSQPPATDQQQTKQDLRCISWVLRTSLDKRIHRLAFDYLRTIPELPPHVEPTFVSDCFNVFLGCINVNRDKVVIVEESKQFVTAVATGFLRAAYQLLATDPTSSAAVDLHRNCRKHFKLRTGENFHGHPFRYTMIAVHALISQDENLPDILWDGNRPTILEHMFFTQYALKRAQETNEKRQLKEVPRWTLRFVSYSLSLDPPPPAFIVANCLKIVAIDLDCDVSGVTTLEEGLQVEKVLSVEAESFFNAEAEETWSAQVVEISWLIAQKLEAMVGTDDPDSRLISSKCKAICALLPHAAFLRQRQLGMVTTETPHIGSPTQSAEPSWCSASPFIAAPLDRRSSHILDRAVLLASPHIPIYEVFWDSSRVSEWNAIALNVLKDAGEDAISEDVVGQRAVSDTVVSQSVAETLLPLAWNDTLRPQILAETWVWLKKPQSLPVSSQGRYYGTTGDVVRHIRGLGDIEILKSYFLLVWSEWDELFDSGLHEMEISIRKDFGGVERWQDREELIERLDQVLAQLSLGPAHFKQRLPRWKWNKNYIEGAVPQYSSLRDTLLDVHEGHEDILLRSRLTFSCALPLPCP